MRFCDSKDGPSSLVLCLDFRNDFYKTFCQNGFLDTVRNLLLFVHHQKQNSSLISMV